MQNFQPTKQQEQLIASYLAGDNVSEKLLSECQQYPALLKEISALVVNDRLLAGELENLNESKLFTDEVIARIEDLQQSSISDKVNQKLVHREAANSWLDKPWSMAASIAAFICFIFVAIVFEEQREFATVTKITATANNHQQLILGNKLGQGEIMLEQGFSEVTLENGVVLVLEAPVELALNSPDSVTVYNGKLVARVPENAIGFRINTPSAEIIDLGTEFGVEVNNNGDSQVHVMEGEVKARANSSQSYKHIKKDEALSFDSNDRIKYIVNNPKEFMRVLPGKSAESPHYLHWSFNQKEYGQFASNRQGFSSDYSAIDKSPTETPIASIEGVFGQGVTFDGFGNWLATEFPGIGNDDPRTVSFWVKVPSDFSTDNAYGIISWGLQQDYSSWQISPNPEAVSGELGRLRIGTFNAEVVGSTDLRDNEWHHVAVVLYGGKTSDISTHILLYVDGKLEKTQNKSIAKINTQLKHPKSKPLTIGRNIGYHPNAKNESQKYFKGSIDELYIVEAALSQTQIQTLMLKNQLRQ